VGHVGCCVGGGVPCGGKHIIIIKIDEHSARLEHTVRFAQRQRLFTDKKMNGGENRNISAAARVGASNGIHMNTTFRECIAQ